MLLLSLLFFIIVKNCDYDVPLHREFDHMSSLMAGFVSLLTITDTYSHQFNPNTLSKLFSGSDLIAVASVNTFCPEQIQCARLAQTLIFPRQIQKFAWGFKHTKVTQKTTWVGKWCRLESPWHHRLICQLEHITILSAHSFGRTTYLF